MKTLRGAPRVAEFVLEGGSPHFILFLRSSICALSEALTHLGPVLTGQNKEHSRQIPLPDIRPQTPRPVLMLCSIMFNLSAY